MYDDTIKVANKIISDKDLADIFQKMNDELVLCEQISKQEEIQNEKYEREYQHWSCKYFNGSFSATINFYDDTNITFDDYNNFMSIFNSRISEIKDMSVYCYLSYTIQHGKELKSVANKIHLFIYENKINIDVKLDSNDNKMNAVYKLIKDKINNAPVKYDRIIKDKRKIITKVSFALGIIPSLVICTLLCFIPIIRQAYSMTFVMYPMLVLALCFVIGGTLSSMKLDQYYKTIVPKEKSEWDSKRGTRVKSDDIDEFVKTSEIIIGKNTRNIHNRKEIEEIEEKYSKNIPYYILITIVLSIIVIIIGFIFR